MKAFKLFVAFATFLVAATMSSCGDDNSNYEEEQHDALLTGKWSFYNGGDSNPKIIEMTLNADGTGTYVGDNSDDNGTLVWSTNGDKLALKLGGSKEKTYTMYSLKGASLTTSEHYVYTRDVPIIGIWYWAYGTDTGVYAYTFNTMGDGYCSYTNENGNNVTEKLTWKRVSADNKISLTIGSEKEKEFIYSFDDAKNLVITSSDGSSFGAGTFIVGPSNISGTWKSTYTESGKLNDGDDRSGTLYISGKTFQYDVIKDKQHLQDVCRMKYINNNIIHISGESDEEALLLYHFRYDKNTKKLNLELSEYDDDFSKYVGYEKE